MVTVPSNDIQEEECSDGKSLERIKKMLPGKLLRIFHPNLTDNLDAYFCIRKRDQQ